MGKGIKYWISILHLRAFLFDLSTCFVIFEFEIQSSRFFKFEIQSSTIAHDRKRTKVAYSITPLENGGSLIKFPSQPPTSLPPPVSPVTPPWLISDAWNWLIPSAKIRFTLWVLSQINEKIVLKIDFDQKNQSWCQGLLW